MKCKPYVEALLDGKTIQWRYLHGVSSWEDFGSFRDAMVHFGVYPDNMARIEYRIKPDPVPDRVQYICMGPVTKPNRPAGWDNDGSYKIHPSQQSTWGKTGEQRREGRYQLKLTIKTDENGVETHHVELVK